jgi:hypothetical protein
MFRIIPIVRLAIVDEQEPKNKDEAAQLSYFLLHHYYINPV